MGEFIDPVVYELKISVNSKLIQFLNIGSEVHLTNLGHTKNWKGTIIRINGKIDLTSQTVKVFVLVKGKQLREGMYLEASFTASHEKNAIEIPRKLIVNEKQIFIVQDSKLELHPIIPVYYNENTVVVKGLKDGTAILSKPLPGAYSGMQVKIHDSNQLNPK